MSRLDDLKARRDQLQKEYDDNRIKEDRLWQAIKHLHTISTTDPIGQMWSQLHGEGKRLSNELQKIRQAIAEEEKNTAAKPSSQARFNSGLRTRRSYDDEEERVCRRCGTPLGHQTLCYRCLTLNG